MPGIIRRADAVDFTEEDWDAVIDTNLKSVFFLCQAAGRHMIAQGSGKIINIASMLTFQGGIRVPSYTASKSGIGGLTKLLANEWAAKGVNVNAIAPGYIATNNTAALQADEARNRSILERIPAGRWGDRQRSGRRGGVPRLLGRGLCPGPYPRRRRRLARAVTPPISLSVELVEARCFPSQEAPAFERAKAEG
jgi:NAD(P)-dependent dehydrogenase (short-subunit alcohol dehydrogenase family)